jgi:hypothetical protein
LARCERPDTLATMWANTVWGFLGLAAAVILAALTPTQAEKLRPYLWALAAISFVASLIVVAWPYLWAVRRTLRVLTVDERYMLAVEGVTLRRTTFGPFPHGEGCYGFMSWDRARATANRLIALGLLQVTENGQYTWTRLGRRVLQHIRADA